MSRVGTASAPATTANLGPLFDVIAVALPLRCAVTAEAADVTSTDKATAESDGATNTANEEEESSSVQEEATSNDDSSASQDEEKPKE